MHILTPRLRSYLLIGLQIFSMALVLNAQSIALGKSFSFGDLQHLEAVADVQISPDGHTVAYSVYSVDIGHDGYNQTFWILRAAGAGVPVALPDIDRPSWSPDGQTLAVVQYGGGKTAVQLL